MKLTTKLLISLLGFATTTALAASPTTIPSNLLQLGYANGSITETTSKATIAYDVKRLVVAGESRYKLFLGALESGRDDYHGLFVGLRTEFSYDTYSNFKLSGAATTSAAKKSYFDYLYKSIYDETLGKLITPNSGKAFSTGLFGTLTYQTQLGNFYADAGVNVGGKFYFFKAVNATNYQTSESTASPLLYGAHLAAGMESLQLRLDYTTSTAASSNVEDQKKVSESYLQASVVFKY